MDLLCKALRILHAHCGHPSIFGGDSDSLGPHGVSAATVGYSALARDLLNFEITSEVDARCVTDGDGITVYVSTSDPRESCLVPQEVQIVALKRLEARAQRDYNSANALHKSIVDAGYQVINVQNENVLARKYRIRLRGIDAPESSMPYGKEAKEELAKIVEGKCLRIYVYGEDRYGRSVGDIYCDGIFVQELMLKEGMAWHYTAYDKREEFAKWEKSARTKRTGLWALSNPEKPWEWRRKNRQEKDAMYLNQILSFSIRGGLCFIYYMYTKINSSAEAGAS